MASNAVYELRTYTAHPGKLDALHARFRNHTDRIFTRHGMKSIGYWTPQDERRDDTLIYVLQHASREAAAKSWEAFRADPEWLQVKAESEAPGPIVLKVVSVYMDATDYSALR